MSFAESFTWVHFVSFERFENGFNTCCRLMELIISYNGSVSLRLFCNPNREINQLSQEEKEYNQRRKINFMLMEKQKIKTFRLSKLMCSNISESRSMGERAFGSGAQPALLLAQFNLKLKMFISNKIAVPKCIEESSENMRKHNNIMQKLQSMRMCRRVRCRRINRRKGKRGNEKQY